MSRFLRAARAWLDLDQRAVADAAGVVQNTLIDAEKGRRKLGAAAQKLVAYYEQNGLVMGHLSDGAVIIKVTAPATAGNEEEPSA